MISFRFVSFRPISFRFYFVSHFTGTRLRVKYKRYVVQHCMVFILTISLHYAEFWGSKCSSSSLGLTSYLNKSIMPMAEKFMLIFYYKSLKIIQMNVIIISHTKNNISDILQFDIIRRVLSFPTVSRFETLWHINHFWN